MLFTKQVLLAILSIGSSWAAVIPRQSAAGTFSITSFFIGASSTSNLASYTFSIADHSTTNSSFSTYCSSTTPSGPGLASVPTTLCVDKSVSFDFSNNGTGYILNLKHLWGQNVQHAIVLAHDDYTDSATVFFDNSQLVNGQTVAGGPFQAKIDAPTAFEVPYSRYA